MLHKVEKLTKISIFSTFLYCRFCKNAIFQNFGNVIFFCRFAFFSPDNFSQLSLNRYAPNLARMCRLASDKTDDVIFEKFKNQVTTAKKHRKIGQFFAPAVTFSLVVKKRLYFLKNHYCDDMI